MPVCLGLQTTWSINCIYTIIHAREVISHPFCLPSVQIYPQSTASIYSLVKLNLCQHFSDTQLTEHKQKMELNKQVERQIFDSYPSDSSNVLLPTGIQGESRVEYSPVHRLLVLEISQLSKKI